MSVWTCLALILNCLGITFSRVYPPCKPLAFNPITNFQFKIWSRIDPSYFWVPDGDLYLYCKGCYFPQNLRSLAYLAERSHFFAYHPYMQGHSGRLNEPSLTNELRCGLVEWTNEREAAITTVALRAQPPTTQFPEWSGGFLNLFRRAQFFDLRHLDADCAGAPCPLIIKIFSREFYDPRFNGYYILSFVSQNGCPNLPIYKHSTRNLYFWGFGCVNSNYIRLGVTIYPDEDYFQCYNQPALFKEIGNRVSNPTYTTMGNRYCLPSLPQLSGSWEERYYSPINNSITITAQRDVEFSILDKQCGITHKVSESYLFNTGNQPFVVSISMGSAKCIGTLISVSHILTLANCFLQDDDDIITELVKSEMITNCRADRNTAQWTDCQRFFVNRKLQSFGDGPLVDPLSHIRINTFSPSDAFNDISDLISWIEFHPLFDSSEFDLAVIGLRTTLQRNHLLYPICLPKYKGTRLYHEHHWEDYQIMYSLKAFTKDTRFSRIKTDVNGPKKFEDCLVKPELNYSTNYFSSNVDDYCYKPTSWEDVLETMPRHDGDRILKNDGGLTYKFYSVEGNIEGRYECDIFYDILIREERIWFLPVEPKDVATWYQLIFLPQEAHRQILGLQRGILECFTAVTIEFAKEIPTLKCYEKRPRCLEAFGFCRVGYEFGYCSEANIGVYGQYPKPGLPDDTPGTTHPLLEVSTFIRSKEICDEGRIVNSPSLICTGHATRMPSEIIVQLDHRYVEYYNESTNSYDDSAKRISYEVVQYINEIQRPLVKIRDKFGRVQVLESSLEGVEHGAGQSLDWDNGAPTYIKFPIHETWTGQDNEPGNAYAVLYSLQKITGRFNNLKIYFDTEVLVAQDNVMKWLSVIMSEVPGSFEFYDPGASSVFVDIKTLTITTTVSSTRLATAWGASPPFVDYTERNYSIPGFEVEWKKTPLPTRPPMILLEAYYDRESLNNTEDIDDGVPLPAMPDFDDDDDQVEEAT